MDKLKISLRAARVNRELTQREASAAVGIDKSTLIKWEQGKTSPDAAKLMQLCELYKISIDNIFLPSKTTLSGFAPPDKKGA